MKEYFYAALSDHNENVIVKGDQKVSLGNKACNAFVEWEWDGKELVLTNDRYGIYPIYYFHNGSEFAISPSISKLLEFLPDIEFDYDALAVFLRLHWLIGEDTIFKAIRAVPPGSRLTWNSSGINVVSTGIIKTQTPISMPREDVIATYAELFQKAVEKTMHSSGSSTVMLSGGRDSRHILFALCRAGNRPDRCTTAMYPSPHSNEDVRIAKLICEELSISHNVVEQPPEQLETEISKNHKLGFCSTEHGWFVAMAECLKRKTVNAYDGIAGDVLSARLLYGHHELDLFRSHKFSDLAETILSRHTYSPKILTSEIVELVAWERAVQHLSKELSKHADQADPVTSFEFWNRTRRTIAPSPFLLLGHSINVITPYLETRLFDFLSYLPADLRMTGKLHTDTIRFAFPEYDHIPYESPKALPKYDNHRLNRLSKDILRYCFSKQKRKILRRSPILARCIRSIVDGNYKVSDFSDEIIYLLQLERLKALFIFTFTQPIFFSL